MMGKLPAGEKLFFSSPNSLLVTLHCNDHRDDSGKFETALGIFLFSISLLIAQMLRSLTSELMCTCGRVNVAPTLFNIALG